MAQLVQLEQSDLLTAGQAQLFYFRLTDIVRQYIERQFDIAAPKLTTAEFLDQATWHETLDHPLRALLRVFLSQADLVKFARFETGAGDAQRAIAKARQFIKPSAVAICCQGERLMFHPPSAWFLLLLLLGQPGPDTRSSRRTAQHHARPAAIGHDVIQAGPTVKAGGN